MIKSDTQRRQASVTIYRYELTLTNSDYKTTKIIGYNPATPTIKNENLTQPFQKKIYKVIKTMPIAENYDQPEFNLSLRLVIALN